MKARSHAFYAAIDQFESPDVIAAVAPNFVMFSHSRTRDLSYLQKEAQIRRDQHSRPCTRTWTDERVYVGPTSAVFVGPPGALARLFAGNWELLRDDVVDDIANWGLKKAKLVRFVARKKK